MHTKKCIKRSTNLHKFQNGIEVTQNKFRTAYVYALESRWFSTNDNVNVFCKLGVITVRKSEMQFKWHFAGAAHDKVKSQVHNQRQQGQWPEVLHTSKNQISDSIMSPWIPSWESDTKRSDILSGGANCAAQHQLQHSTITCLPQMLISY